MLLPRTFADDVFDDFFDFDEFPFFDNRAERKMEKKLYGRRAKNLMKTDIKEKKDGYELGKTAVISGKNVSAAPVRGASMWEKI